MPSPRKPNAKRDAALSDRSLIASRVSGVVPFDICDRAYGYALLGATNGELAVLLAVNDATISKWLAEDEAFCLAVQKGKAQADANVVASLYRNAIGFEYPAVKMFQSDGQVISEQYMEYHPPQTTAQIFWLQNRQRDRWKSVVSGSSNGDGVGIAIQINLG